ncbi:Nucleic acid- OB- Cold-shock protein [Tubulinosema ratisbonensis]|uniref:Nucleic acid-OB-Cold-shock protein n=1 Tax=Tubulinosema ratisbonensis TaxID=291195 RepID=A0A437AHM3_9MICR|nr:putative Nucleic acid-binding, OB-fold protein [Tubulinosema ratisbonensis]RVD91906.1 Nucleic acid- OB- Cold-shock protein [Tubulinosema ratisbonensis]
MQNSKRYRGCVKFYSYKRGFGFIICDDPLIKEDIFFHFTSIAKQEDMDLYLLPNEILEFDLIRGPNGFLAKNVTSPDYKIRKNKSNRLDIFKYYKKSFEKILDEIISQNSFDKMDKEEEKK